MTDPGSPLHRDVGQPSSGQPIIPICGADGSFCAIECSDKAKSTVAGTAFETIMSESQGTTENRELLMRLLAVRQARVGKK